jgi:hypothetical protein
MTKKNHFPFYRIIYTEKNGAVLSQRGFYELKKGFIHEAKLKKCFLGNLRNL